MSKKETLSTFTEGLVMDLNPLTTPNNVLTNAIHQYGLRVVSDIKMKNNSGQDMENLLLKPVCPID